MSSGNIPSDKASTPFSTANGMPVAPVSGGKGGNDFLSNPSGTGDKSGGRDFTKENRPQTEARPEVVPNPQSIPNGGKITKVGLGSAAPSLGGSQGVEPSKKPFNL